MNTPSNTSSAIIDGYLDKGLPFAIINKQAGDESHILGGDVLSLKNLADIPRGRSTPEGTFGYDTLSVIPYSQARESGLNAKEDGSAIRCMQISTQIRVKTKDLLASLPETTIVLEDGIRYSESEEEYADIVRRVINEQIKEGNLCNCVISTTATCNIQGMMPRKVLGIFRKILANEFGAYMTFFFYDGENYHIGASPERQLTVDHGEVRMNPISGTFRKANGEIDREKFLEFLKNPKEQNELFMCMDEELKQMAQMCKKGGVIIGPLLKEMSKLVHTEYELVGRSEEDLIDLLRTSLHAPTVTGSPRASAHSVIASMEKTGRGYYAGTLALTGHHEDGTEFLDSAIMIRAMRILPNGLVSMRVGSSIVRDSIPEEEAKEGRAKLAGICAALVANNPGQTVPQLPLIMDADIQEILRSRNADLNQYLMQDQEGVDLTVPELKGKTITIIDDEDQFSHMLGHMTAAMGAEVRVIPVADYDFASCDADIVIVGPGPGNPTDMSSEKMQKVRVITDALRERDRTFMSICLGHQILCDSLGMPLVKKENPSQGMQRTVPLFGEDEKLAFYNTFTAVHTDAIDGVDICSDADTGETFAIRGRNFTGFQFHPESVMSKNGFPLLAKELCRILKNDPVID